jgi:amino acid permease
MPSYPGRERGSSINSNGASDAPLLTQLDGPNDELIDFDSLNPDNDGGAERCCCMKGKSSDHSRTQRIQKLANAVFNVSNAAIGSGVLAFPFAYRQSGYVLGMIITIGASFLLGYSLSVLSRYAREHDAQTYQELAFKVFGAKAKLGIVTTQVTYCFFTGIAYLMVLSSMVLPALQGAFGEELTRSHVVVGVTVLVLPLCLLRNIDKLGFTSTVGILSMGYACGVIMYYSLTTQRDPNTPPAFEARAFNLKPCAFQVFPIVDFALMCHLTIIPAVQGLQPYWPSKNRPGKTRYRSLLFICILVMLICDVLYMPTGTLGYILFGKDVTSDILNNFGERGATIYVPTSAAVRAARFCVGLCMFFSFPIPAYVGLKSVKDIFRLEIDGPLPTTKHVGLVVCWSLTIMVATVIVLALHLDLGFVCSIVGCTAAVISQYLFPGFLLKHGGRTCMGNAYLILGGIMCALGVFVTFASASCANSDSEFCTTMGYHVKA